MSCCRRRAEKRAAAAGDLEAGALEPAPAKPRKFHLGQLYRGAPILDRVVLVIGVLSAAAHGAMTPSFAILMAEGIRVTATATQANVGAAIGTVVSIMLFITTASLILGFLWTTAFFWFAGRQVARLRTEYFNCVLTRDLGWFDQNQPAALPARMVTETKAIHEALGTRSGEIVVYFSQFVFALAAAFARGWELTLVICGVIPVILGVGHLMTHKMKAATKEEDAWLAKAGAVTEESLLGIRTVVAFGAERREESRLHAELQGARRGGLRASLATGLSFGFLLLFLSCSFALAFWYGSHQMIARGGRSQVDVIIVVIVVVIGVSSVTNIEGPADIFVKATSAAASMCSVLDAPSRIEGSGEAETEGPMEVTTVETIEFRDVYFSYPSRADVPILDGLNLSIAKGQKVAMVGASGSGKSTVVQLLERFYDPVSGGVFVNGVALQRLPVHGWRRLIGYVGQEPVLFQCSVTDNIRGGDPTMSDEVVAEAAKQAEAFDFVTSLPGGFQTWVGVGGGQMSGGQKQRIAIARALAKMPQVLILDEATSALDNESEKQVQATLDQLQSSACRGLTTISVAHRLSTVRNADAIFVLKNGKVVEQGTHADLIERREEYFSLVEAQRTAQDEEGGDGSDDEDAEEEACAEDAAVADGCPTPQSCLRSLSDHRDFSQVFSAASSPATHKSGEQLPEHPAVADHRCMRRLIGLTRPEWALYPFGIVASLITGANLPVQGLLLSKGIASLYIQPTDRMLASVDAWSLGLVLLGLATLVGEAAKHSFFGYIQRCLTTRVRVMAFGSLLRQEIGLFDDPAANIPSVSSGIARAAQDIAMMTGIGIGNTVQALFGVVAGLALAFAATWKLTLVVIALIPLVAASMIIVSVVLTDPFDSEAHTMADAVTATAVLNIRTVRSFVAEKSFSYLFSQAISQIARAEASAAPKKGLALAINSAVIFLVYLVGMWYGAQLISSDGLDPASVYQALICVTLGFSGAGLAASYGPIIRHGRRSAMALFGVVDRQSKINAEATSGKHQDAGDGTVEFRNVTFRFPHRVEQRVLKHMSLKVQKGQTVALVGPSGGGKSTIVQLLLRYYDPSHGAVKVGNMDLRCFDLVWWRRQVGLVGQEPVLFDVSLEDNIKYGYPEATREEVEAAAREANMDYAFNGTIAWEDRLGIRGERLSGGQKQRCAIARAIVRRPQLLLLDEATSALDSASEQVVQVALDNVRKGRTTFTIAHRLSTIKDSDVILVVSSGHIVERGTHEELLARRGWYAQMAPQ